MPDFEDRIDFYHYVAFEDSKIIYYFWLVKSMYTASQKNTRLLFDISLIMEKFGTTRSGLDILHNFGLLPTASNFKKKSLKEIVRYDEKLRQLCLMSALFWIDNFAKFLKHVLLNRTDGSASSNQMTAVAAQKVAFDLRIPPGFTKPSWPTVPCSEGAKKHILAIVTAIWDSLKVSKFKVLSIIFLPNDICVPLKASVRTFCLYVFFNNNNYFLLERRR